MNNETDIDVQYVSPLKKICMTIGELPSSYLETMSYYEMLVWLTEYLKNTVIPTVNNNAEAVEELQSLYEELRTYVNEYFDNLDVQEEINNKLDEMAQDGSLTDLIRNYIDPLINAQNTRITSVENEVQSIASGSPAGVYATVEALTTADPNHSKIYVVNSDGKWYYYDTTNSEWTAGGTYQSTNLLDGSVTYEKLETNLQNTLDLNFEVDSQNFTYTQNYYFKNNGQIVAETSAGLPANSIGYFVKDVSVGEIYKITAHGEGNAQGYAIVDSDDEIIEISSGNITDEIVEIPNNGAKLYVNYWLTRTPIVEISKNNYFYASDSVENELIKPVKNAIHVKNSTTQNSQYGMYIKFVEFDITTSDIALSENDLINIELKCYSKSNHIKGACVFYKSTTVTNWNGRGATYFTNNGQHVLISFKVLSGMTTLNRMIIAIGFDNNDVSNDYYMWDIKMVNTTKNTTLSNIESKVVTDSDVKIQDFSKFQYLNDISYDTLLSLSGKKLVFFGDSIVNGQGGTPYSPRLASLLDLSLSTKQGYSGATISQQNNNLCLVDKIKAFDFTNYDYCLIQIGTNDLTYNVELGTLETYSTTYDDSKFYDSFRDALDFILTNNPNIKIVLLTPLQRFVYGGYTPLSRNNANLNLIDYSNAIKNIGEFYSIPVIDMLGNAGINYHTYSIYTADGLHPNNDGYERITDYLAKELLSK